MNPISDNIIKDGERLNAEMAKRVKSGTGMTFQAGELGELQAYIAELLKENSLLSGMCEKLKSDKDRLDFAEKHDLFGCKDILDLRETIDEVMATTIDDDQAIAAMKE